MPKNKPAFTDTQLLDALERDIRECGGLTLWVADTAADEFPGGPRGLLFGKLHRGRSLRRSLEVIARREGKQDEALKALKESAESKVQRLTEELSERNSYIANYEHATQIERAERDTELSALRAELAEAKDTLKEHEEEHWCFNAEHGQVIIERDRLRAELKAVKRSNWIHDAVRDVAELPDRDSPEDWPEAMLVTAKELRAIIRNRADDAISAMTAQPDTPAAQPARHSEALSSFTAYCKDHPSQRFWQALRNWSRWNFILGAQTRDGGTIDTFNLEGLDGTHAAQPATEQPRIWRVRNAQGILYCAGTGDEVDSRKCAAKFDLTLVYSLDNGETWIDEQAEREGK